MVKLEIDEHSQFFSFLLRNPFPFFKKVLWVFADFPWLDFNILSRDPSRLCIKSFGATRLGSSNVSWSYISEKSFGVSLGILELLEWSFIAAFIYYSRSYSKVRGFAFKGFSSRSKYYLLSLSGVSYSKISATILLVVFFEFLIPA
jgi:hypothetical protein